MHIVVHDSLAEVDSEQWNAMLEDDNPFMRHEFLSGLEETNCVGDACGWKPTHIVAYQDSSLGKIAGALPCYQKDNSYGEYIFDWAWADAHIRHGLEYYPKLLNAAPFTPATGPRILVNSNQDRSSVIDTLISAALEIVDSRELSSFHSLFLTEQQCGELKNDDLLKRHSSQFHWQNGGYGNFDDFLNQLSSKKRKNIKRERRRVKESDVRYQWVSGDDLNSSMAEQMYAFYLSTIHQYCAQAYLNQAFFKYLVEHFSHQTLFLFAYYQEQIIAGGLYFRGKSTLYGRYWGALNNFHSVHFETCYYQAIEWCIKNNYQRFEAGAQGQHKLARGLLPVTTYSAHYIRQPQFRNAISEYVDQEKNQLDGYARQLQSHSPFKQDLG